MDTNMVFTRKHVLWVILGATLLIVIGIVVVTKGNLTSPSQLFKKEVTAVEIKKTYKNPFAKNSQYVNPFQEYKNPFITNR